MPATFAAAVRFCTTCRADVGFEQPECLDGHDGDCPEWVCTACDEAFLVGYAPPEAPAARFRSVA